MNHELNEILAQIDLKEWLEDQGIDYRSAGSNNLKLRECPFCGDTRHKVYFSIPKKRGICYHGSCGKTFNLFSFAREHLHTDTRETINHFESYARSAGLSAGAPVIAAAPVTSGEWQMPVSVPLPTDEGATHPFLIERHIILETQARFGLRWCEAGEHRFVFEGKECSQDFSQRVLIPVADLDGVIKSFQGRDATGLSERRYLFPTSLPGTGRFLYGGHLVKGVPNLVLNEGPFDVMATWQAIAGHPDYKGWSAIGSFGLSIGQGDDNADDQLARIRQLKRDGLKHVTVMWDGEHGATLAALEVAKTISAEGIQVKIALLPEGKDPNEVETKVVRDAIQNAHQFDLGLYVQWKIAPPYPDK